MPLTFAHPAAVLPLARQKLVFSALVVGSMAPDFEYFLRLSTGTHFGHTPMGLLLFTVPAGLAGLWIFHILLKWPLLSLLPTSHQQRLIPFAKEFHFGPGRRFGLILVSLFLGALTHLAWDSLTHLDGWTVRHFDFLSRVVWKTRFGGVQFCRILQHMSTLLGFTVMAICYGNWLRRTPVATADPLPQLSKRAKLRVVFYIGLTAFLLGCFYAVAHPHPQWNLMAVQVFYLQVILVSITSVSITSTFLGLGLYSLWWQTFPGRSWNRPLPTSDERQPDAA